MPRYVDNCLSESMFLDGVSERKDKRSGKVFVLKTPNSDNHEYFDRNEISNNLNCSFGIRKVKFCLVQFNLRVSWKMTRKNEKVEEKTVRRSFASKLSTRLNITNGQAESHKVEVETGTLRKQDTERVKLSTYLSTYLPTYQPTYLPTYLPTYQPTYLPTYLPIYLELLGVPTTTTTTPGVPLKHDVSTSS
ncbi:hypothetical protein M0802_009034 [Mischocyttarus mexicanus]|nr:hypothetical protein M0802_009034 [Mischocyttarus mexicanus]